MSPIEKYREPKLTAPDKTGLWLTRKANDLGPPGHALQEADFSVALFLSSWIRDS